MSTETKHTKELPIAFLVGGEFAVVGLDAWRTCGWVDKRIAARAFPDHWIPLYPDSNKRISTLEAQNKELREAVKGYESRIQQLEQEAFADSDHDIGN
jgi:hypothetical protein